MGGPRFQSWRRRYFFSGQEKGILWDRLNTPQIRNNRTHSSALTSVQIRQQQFQVKWLAYLHLVKRSRRPSDLGRLQGGREERGEAGLFKIIIVNPQ